MWRSSPILPRGESTSNFDVAYTHRRLGGTWPLASQNRRSYFQGEQGSRRLMVEAKVNDDMCACVVYGNLNSSRVR